jgi:hypothetical protein
MKKTISIIALAIVGVCVFSACTVLPAIAAVLDPSTPSADWAERAHFAMLMKKPEKELLTEEEKLRAAKNICALKHLDKRKNINDEEAKTFCKLEKNDKIYFYNWCIECGGAVGTRDTSYLLVRDGKAFEAVKIETRRDRKLHKSFPIIERLH